MTGLGEKPGLHLVTAMHRPKERLICKLTDWSTKGLYRHTSRIGRPNAPDVMVKRPMCGHPHSLCDTAGHSRDLAFAAYHGTGSGLDKWKKTTATRLKCLTYSVSQDIPSGSHATRRLSVSDIILTWFLAGAISGKYANTAT